MYNHEEVSVCLSSVDVTVKPGGLGGTLQQGGHYSPYSVFSAARAMVGEVLHPKCESVSRACLGKAAPHLSSSLS